MQAKLTPNAASLVPPEIANELRSTLSEFVNNLPNSPFT